MREGRGIRKILIFGLSNWVGGGVTVEVEKVLGRSRFGEKISSEREVTSIY